VTTRKSRTTRGTPRPAPAASLLIELLTEELPPKSLKRLSESLRDQVFAALKEQGFLVDGSAARAFATPRRLAVRVTGVRAQQPDRTVERRGPAVGAGFDAQGQPTQALLGFARSCGVDVSALERQRGDKGEYFVYRARQKGEPLAVHLAPLVEAALKKLPVAKLMRWGSGEAQFVRPVHGVVMIHGSRTVPGEVLGLKSRNKTLGHRFLSKGLIAIPNADAYEARLRKPGFVVANFDERRAEIDRRLREAAGQNLVLDTGFSNPTGDLDAATWILQGNQNLLDEVAALVEWPIVYEGQFDEDFLAVPAQCISLTMQKNQKYFALVNRHAELLPRFLVVSNLEVRDPHNIVHGNERVLRARLADARFFFEQDRKTKLAERVPRLANVVYHNRLGTQLERVQRIQKLAVAIGQCLGVKDRGFVERAAYLCKADLLTEMVSEFPELQGLMGFYYARYDDEPSEVAGAIREHYLPRFAGDVLPRTTEGLCVALADKLYALVGFFAIDQAPTGEKDPFGLRRQGLGIARILMERSLSLDIFQLCALARDLYPDSVFHGKDTGLINRGNVAGTVAVFILERLPPFLRERGYAVDEIDAVMALNPDHPRLDLVTKRLDALKAFRALPEAAALAAANKRIQNILPQAGETSGEPVDGSLLREEAEHELLARVTEVRAKVEPLFAAGDYAGALMRLAALRDPVDLFFDKVMVMVDDEMLRASRLRLLRQIRELFLNVADFSRLQS